MHYVTDISGLTCIGLEFEGLDPVFSFAWFLHILLLFAEIDDRPMPA